MNFAAGTFADGCVALDLEVGKRDERIDKLGAVRADTGQSLTLSCGNLAKALTELDDFADGATCLLGHNLIRFDVPHLQAANPKLRLLRLPRVDTLWLNPLAFPPQPLPSPGQALSGCATQTRADQRSGIGCTPRPASAWRTTEGVARSVARPAAFLALADRRWCGWHGVRGVLQRPAAVAATG